MLVEAMTYRFRGHSMADPEEYRTKEQVERVALRDPIVTSATRLEAEGVLDGRRREELDAAAIARVDAAVAFADASPRPPPESLYDDVYVLGDQVRGWYSVDERSPESAPRRGRARARRRRAPRRPARASGEGSERRAAPAATAARGPLTADARGRRLTARHPLPRGAQRGPARGDGARRRSSSWARTSASSTAPSRSPTACWRSSARRACATRRSPRTRSSAWASAPR